MIELGDQQVLALLGALALRDVASQALETHEPSSGVELGARGFLEPHFAAVRPNEAERERIGRVLRGDAAHESLEFRAVIRVDLREKPGREKWLFRIEPEDVSSIRAASGQAGADIPVEGRHRSDRQRFLQPGLAFHEHGLVLPSLGEQRRKNECAERHGEDAGLGAQDAVGNRKTGVAEKTDVEGRRPDDRERHDERGRRGEDRPATGRKPQQHREQQRDRHDGSPRAPAAGK